MVAASRKSTPELDALDGSGGPDTPVLVHVPVDLTDPDAPEQVVQAAVDTFGGLDILVNNAGGPPPGTRLPRFTFLAPSDDDWRAMYEFNLFSAVRAIRAAIPRLLRARGRFDREHHLDAGQAAGGVERGLFVGEGSTRRM